MEEKWNYFINMQKEYGRKCTIITVAEPMTPIVVFSFIHQLSFKLPGKYTQASEMPQCKMISISVYEFHGIEFMLLLHWPGFSVQPSANYLLLNWMVPWSQAVPLHQHHALWHLVAGWTVKSREYCQVLGVGFLPNQAVSNVNTIHVWMHVPYNLCR